MKVTAFNSRHTRFPSGVSYVTSICIPARRWIHASVWFAGFPYAWRSTSGIIELGGGGEGEGEREGEGEGKGEGEGGGDTLELSRAAVWELAADTEIKKRISFHTNITHTKYMSKVGIASNHTDASSVESHSSLGLTHMWVLINTTWFQGWGNWVWLFLHGTWPMKYSTRSSLSIIFISQNTQLLIVPHDTTSDRYLTGPKATPPSYSTFYVIYTSLKCI